MKLNSISENENKQYQNYGKTIKKQWQHVKECWKNFTIPFKQ